MTRMRLNPLSDDQDVLKLMQAMHAVNVANEISKQMIEELTEIMGKSMSKAEIKQIREDNVCGPCGLTRADGWVLTACGEEQHVVTRRICENCRYWWAAEAVHLCPRCTAVLWDWAYKADTDAMWATTWGSEE